MGVPIFIMITGYLLLSKAENLYTYFNKRIKKIFLPFLFWSLFYLLISSLTEPKKMLTLNGIVSDFIGNRIFYHLWYMYVLIGLYLIIPILRTYIQNTSKKNRYYLLTIWFMWTIIFPFFPYAGLNLRPSLDLKLVSGYWGYLILGYLIGEMNISNKHVFLSIVVYMWSVVFTAIAVFFEVSHSSSNIFYFYSYLSPNIIVMGASSLIFLKYFANKILLINPIFTNISKASLGIYLLHPAVIIGLSRVGLTVFSSNPALTIPLITVISFWFSYSIIRVVQKIPILNKFV